MSQFSVNFSDPNDTIIPDGSTFMSAIPDGNGTFTVTWQPPVDEATNETPPPIIISGCIGGHPHRPA